MVVHCEHSMSIPSLPISHVNVQMLSSNIWATRWEYTFSQGHNLIPHTIGNVFIMTQIGAKLTNTNWAESQADHITLSHKMTGNHNNDTHVKSLGLENGRGRWVRHWTTDHLVVGSQPTYAWDACLSLPHHSCHENWLTQFNYLNRSICIQVVYTIQLYFHA